MKTISSSATWFYKIVFPTMWIGITGATGGWSWYQDAPGAPISLMLMIFGCAFLYWTCIRLKKVSIDGRDLVVSNLLREVRIPISELESVSSSWLIRPESICLHFKHGTSFSRRVLFMPPLRLFPGSTPHPLIAEIERLRKSYRIASI
jgi:hypothetical protein